MYPDKEVPNKAVHQLVTTFWVGACIQGGGGHFQDLL
jgi:hypothetical protein